MTRATPAQARRGAYLLLVCLLLPVAPAAADTSAAAAEFWAAADAYERRSSDAADRAQAAPSERRPLYDRLADVYAEMGLIKVRAAELAEAGRGDEIRWGRYEALDRERSQLEEALSGQGAEARTHDAPSPEVKTLLEAARVYQAQARREEKAAAKTDYPDRPVHRELSNLYYEMAAIKRRAAEAADAGQPFDWSRYRQLTARRDALEGALQAAAKRAD